MLGSTSEFQALRAKCFIATKGKLHPRAPNKDSCYLTLYFICALLKSFNCVSMYSPAPAISGVSQKENTAPSVAEITLEPSKQNVSLINQKHLSH